MNKRMRIVTTPGNLYRDIENAWNASQPREICPDCEHEVIEGDLKCPTCSSADYLTDADIQTEDF